MPDFSLLIPEFLMAGLAFLVLGADLVLPPHRRTWLAGVTVVGLVAVGAFSVTFLAGREATLYDGLYRVDAYATFFKGFFPAVGILVALVSVDYVRRHLTNPGEFYGLLVFTVLAMEMMAAAGELLTAYISLELLSFSLYILASYARESAKSNEAGVKYVLLGAFSTALLLYGISLVYTTVGTTHFAGINSALAARGSLEPSLLAGLVLIIAGLGFKVAAVPFHMWAPDVYEGAPTPVTAYIATGSKAGAFVLALRLFGEAFAPAAGQWWLVLALLAALTMTVGNLVALAQRNIKRLLAYSSIGQAGYLLMGVAALWTIGDGGVTGPNVLAANGVVFHLAGYIVANLAAFFCVILVFSATGKEDIPDFAGLGRSSPLVAVVMSIALFSLAGLPFFAGFTTKFYLFTAAAQGGLLWLAGLAIVNSLISLYYYLVVIRTMYIQPAPEGTALRLSALSVGVLMVLVAGVVVLGLYPNPLVEAIQGATSVVLVS